MLKNSNNYTNQNTSQVPSTGSNIISNHQLVTLQFPSSTILSQQQPSRLPEKPSLNKNKRIENETNEYEDSGSDEDDDGPAPAPLPRPDRTKSVSI